MCSSTGTLNLFAFRAQKSVGAKFRENRQRFEKTGRESQLKITRVKWGDRQERAARYYRTAQEEHERCRAEARSRIEASQRAIEQVRGRKSGIKELAQKLFERIRIIVQKRIERYRDRLQNDQKITEMLLKKPKYKTKI